MKTPMSAFTRSHTHRSPHLSELAAAEKAEGYAPSIRARIVEQLEAAGAGGMTPDEFCDANGMLINTVRRRFTDLWKDGLIRHHPKELRRPNSAGNECVAWVLGEDPDRGQPRVALRQRRPLPESKILELAPDGMSPIMAVDFARAIEGQHGIRLAEE